MAVASATPYGIRYASPYYAGSSSSYYTGSYNYGTPLTYAVPQAASGFPAFNGPITRDAATLIKAGVQPLNQAANKLNELSAQLPQSLANIDPATKGDIAKVNDIVSDVCTQAMAGNKPTSYTMNYTPDGLNEMCGYIAKIGSDILGGLDNPAIFQKYTADLQKAIVALNAKAYEITA